jgi:spore maturation protein CgeB
VIERVAPELFFCGHLFENRRKFLQALFERTPGFATRVLAMGTTEPGKEAPWWSSTTAPNRSLPDFYATAVAVLNIGRDLSLANQRYMIKASTPGPRTFEAACAGAAQIFVGDGLEIENYFEADREILLADSVDSFIVQWERLTADRALSLDIGRRAQARALADHTYASRAKTLVKLAGRV